MWFRSVFDFLRLDSRNQSRRRRAAASRLLLELLEDRTVPSFLAPVDYAAGSHPQAVAAGSFRNNGIQDLVVTNPTADTVSVLLGNGNGTFQPPLTLTTGPDPTSVAVGDFGNGHLDIVTTNAASLTMLLGNGDGTFQPPINFTLPGEFPSGYSGSTPVPQTPLSLAVGDMNHDGKLDLVVTGSASYSYSSGPYTYDATQGYVNVLLGNGDGTFTPASATPLEFPSRPPVMVLGDFNGDGKLDIVLGEANAGLTVLLGNGDGTVGAPKVQLAGEDPLSLATGDINGDGKLDLAMITGNGGVTVLLGNGDGTFQKPVNTVLPGISPAGYQGVNPLPLQQFAEGVVVGDLTGDGKLDLAVTATSDYLVYAGTAIDPWYGTPYKVYDGVYKSNVNVLVGNGNGTFTDSQIIPLADGTPPSIYGPYPFSLTEGNFNNDAVPDLAVPDYGTGNVSVLINDASWPTFTVSGFPLPTTAGASGSFTVRVENPDGTTDTGYTGTVHFTSSDNQAVLPEDYTFTAADAGVHSFSATLKSAGTRSITATDTTTGSITGSDSGITVLPAEASQLFFTGQPTSKTAGEAISPVRVDVTDQYGNVVTTNSSTVTLTLSSGTFAGGSATVSAAASSGVATFSTLKIDTAASYTMKASDGSLTAATSAGFTISPAGPSKFILTAPASVNAGASFSLTLTVEDAYGNIVTNYTGTVHFSSTDSRATLPPNCTFTNSDKGVHTFTGLVLRTKGKQKITISDTRNGPLTGTWPTAILIEDVL
jgi:hypothetical protein